jgi:hypothetical protein
MQYYIYTAAVVSMRLTFKTERWFVVTGSITVHGTSTCVSLYTTVTQNSRLLFLLQRELFSS